MPGEEIALLIEAGAALSGPVLKMFEKANEALKNLADQAFYNAKKLGIQSEAYQRLAFASKLAGVSQEQFSSSMGNLSDRIKSANAGDEKAASLFQTLGIDPKTGLQEIENTIAIIADQIANMPNGAKKRNLAEFLFGSSDFLPLLNQGGQAIAEATDKAEYYNQVMSADGARSAALFNQNMQEVQRIFSGFGTILAEEMLPLMNDIVQYFLAFYEANKPIIDGAIRGAVAGIVLGLRGLFASIEPIIVGVSTLIFGFEFLSDLIARFIALFITSAVKVTKPWVDAFKALFDFLISGFTDIGKIAVGLFQNPLETWEDIKSGKAFSKSKAAFQDVKKNVVIPVVEIAQEVVKGAPDAFGAHMKKWGPRLDAYSQYSGLKEYPNQLHGEETLDQKNPNNSFKVEEILSKNPSAVLPSTNVVSAGAVNNKTISMENRIDFNLGEGSLESQIKRAVREALDTFINNANNALGMQVY